MPSRSSRSNALKPENKAFVVFISILQLTAVAAVWLLAIIPVGLMALAATLWKRAPKLLMSVSGSKNAPRT